MWEAASAARPRGRRAREFAYGNGPETRGGARCPTTGPCPLPRQGRCADATPAYPPARPARGHVLGAQPAIAGDPEQSRLDDWWNHQRVPGSASGGPSPLFADDFTVLGHANLGGGVPNGDVYFFDHGGSVGKYAYIGTWSAQCTGQGAKIVDVNDSGRPRWVGFVGARKDSSNETWTSSRSAIGTSSGSGCSRAAQRVRPACRHRGRRPPIWRPRDDGPAAVTPGPGDPRRHRETRPSARRGGRDRPRTLRPSHAAGVRRGHPRAAGRPLSNRSPWSRASAR